jgi:hypothetical protein
MSEQQPASGSDDASTITNTDGTWSANGTEHEDAIAAAADSEVTDADPTEVADSDSTVAPIATDSSGETTASTSHDDPGAFLSELVRAMQTTAGTERARIAEQTDRRREENLAAIQARRDAEAQKMRDLADDDLKAIDAWAEDERQRIQVERERRAGALSDDLQKSLAEHGARIESEIEGVEAAIATYRVEVDAFFVVLDGETDPVAIAQHASRRPVFPDLDKPVDAAAVSVTADAARDATSAGIDSVADIPSADATTGDVAEPAAIPVMDTNPGSRLAASFANWSGTSPAAESDLAAEADPSSDPVSTGDQTETEVAVAVGHGANDDSPGTILHAVPSGRPLSWLRRGNDSSDRPSDDR